MQNIPTYDFTSERLGFRNWHSSDLDNMFELNQDKEVMKYFPTLQDRETTSTFIQRMQEQYLEYSYCYFAVEKLANKEFLGFIGISNQDYGEELGKFVDIGWRLKQTAWGNGYATEGAKECLKWAKTTIGLTEIYAVAPAINEPSIHVMRKIGMHPVKEFVHPKLLDYNKIKQCVLYQINL